MKAADGTKIAERALEVPCEMCRGTGEILSTDHGDVPCPDCISREHQKRFSAAEERERKLLASLADADTVHANILRGTIALTKAQAIHIAGLPADIEERERVLRDALEEIRELAMTFALVGNESQRALSESVIGILRRAALATPAPEQPNRPCSHCGHSNPHTSPAGRIADGCNEAGCYCAYYAPAHPAGMPEMPESWATSDPEAAMQAYADACADAEQPADCFGNDDSSRRVAAVKGACARAGGFSKDAEHGYAGRNAESWRWGWEYANDCLNDPNYHPPAPQQPAPKRYRLNSGPCAAQIVDCDCRFCCPELEDRPAEKGPVSE